MIAFRHAGPRRAPMFATALFAAGLCALSALAAGLYNWLAHSSPEKQLADAWQVLNFDQPPSYGLAVNLSFSLLGGSLLGILAVLLVNWRLDNGDATTFHTSSFGRLWGSCADLVLEASAYSFIVGVLAQIYPMFWPIVDYWHTVLSA